MVKLSSAYAPRWIILVLTVVASGCAGGKIKDLTATIGIRDLRVRNLEAEVSALETELRQERANGARLDRALGRRANEIERKDRELEDYRLQLASIREDNQLQLAAMQADVTECSTRLNRAEMANVRELLAQVEGLQATLAETEPKARYRGQLDIWESLSVESIPTSTGRLFKKHYADFKVKVKNRVVFTHRVETKGASSAARQVLATAISLASLVPLFAGD